MGIVKWRDEFSVGVELMDSQHAEIIRLINVLHDGIAKGTTGDALQNVISGLVSYTEQHFADEEAFMDQIGHRELEEHRKIHKELAHKVVDFKQQLAQEEVTVKQISHFLRRWLLDHIVEEDMKYAQK